jgi:hypothetical protein
MINTVLINSIADNLEHKTSSLKFELKTSDRGNLVSFLADSPEYAVTLFCI